MSKNIESAVTGVPTWNAADVPASLDAVRAYVEQEAKKASDWYFSRKTWKARWSWGLRFLAIVLAAFGGLFPILAYIMAGLPAGASAPAAGTTAAAWSPGPSSGLWASLFVGVAAGLVALDRTFGFSTGWIRYVTTGTMIRRALEEFRLEWVAKRVEAGARPTTAQALALIKLAKDARVAIEEHVLSETKAWATEFQNNLTQLERDARQQFEALQLQTAKNMEAAQQASRQAALEVTVTNAGDTDTRGFDVTLTSPDGAKIEDTLVGQSRWAQVGLRPGHYLLNVRSTIMNAPVSANQVCDVAPGAICRMELALPVAKRTAAPGTGTVATPPARSS